jgi:vacuolar-type H+-ATPase subunit C/Vma6
MPAQNYWFAVGKVRSLEKRLLSQVVFEQAAVSSLPEALKIFAESVLGGERLLQVKDSAGVEDFLAGEKRELKKLVLSLLPDKYYPRLLDQRSVKELGVLLKHVNQELIVDFLRHTADMHNIGVYLRLRLCRRPQQELLPELAEGGFIESKSFIRLYGADPALFLHRLANVHKRGRMIDYTFWLAEGIRQAEMKNSFVLLEKKMKDFLFWLLRPAKYISCGPEPVLAYYYGRLNEIELIRLVLLGKIFNFDPVTMKERINSVYA